MASAKRKFRRSRGPTPGSTQEPSLGARDSGIILWILLNYAEHARCVEPNPFGEAFNTFCAMLGEDRVAFALDKAAPVFSCIQESKDLEAVRSGMMSQEEKEAFNKRWDAIREVVPV